MSQRSMKNGHASQRARELIKAAIEESDLTVTEVAQRADLPRPTLQNILGGRANIYVEQLVALARSLGVSAAEWIDIIEAELLAASKKTPRVKGATRVTRPKGN